MGVTPLRRIGVLCLAVALVAAAAVGTAAAGPGKEALEPAGNDSAVGTDLERQASLAASETASRASVAADDGARTPNVVLLAIDAPTTGPIVAGETITVNVIGANVDSFTGERTVEFYVDGEHRDERSVELDPDETHTFTFAYETRADDVGDLDIAVVSNNTIERTLAVEAPTEPAILSATIANATTDLVAGDPLEVEAVVENSLGISEEKPVELVVDGAVVDETTVNLFGPQRRTLAFEYETDEGDVGDLNVSVRTPDDADYRTVHVGTVPGPFFDVELVDAPDAVQVGGTATIEAVVENTGAGAGEQSVAFVFGDRVIGETEYALIPGERRRLTFEYATVEGDLGEHEVGVASADDAARTTVVVQDPPTPAYFDVEIVDAPAAVTAGEAVTVEATVENAGELAGEQSIAFRVDGTLLEESTLSLDAGESETMSFTSENAESDVGPLEIAVSSANDSATREVTVREPPTPAFVSVYLVDAPRTVEAGETITVDAIAYNVGDLATDQRIEFAVDGRVESTTDVSLDGGAYERLSFAYETDASDAGDLPVAVSSDDDTATKTVEVREPPEPALFDVTITDAPAEVEVGGDVTVEVAVENTGDRAGEQPIEFRVDGALESTANVTLDGGETESLSFTYQTDASDAGGLSIAVSSDDESASHTVDVTEPPEPALFDVAITNAPAEVEGGENVSIEAVVENTGDLAGEQPIEFRVDGALESTTTVALDGGESESLSFVSETDASDVGEIVLEVSSEDDAATRTVAVAEPEPVGVTPSVGALIHATEDVELNRGTFDLHGDVVTGGAYRQSPDATVTGSSEVREGEAVARTPHDAYIDDLVASGAGEFTSLWDDRYDPEGGCENVWTCEARVFDEAGVHYLDDVSLQSGQAADVVVDLADVDEGEVIDVVVDGDLHLQSAALRVENWETGAVRFWVAGDVTVHRMDRPIVGPVGSDGTNADVLQLYGISSTDVTFAEASVQFEGVVSAPGATVALRNGEHVVHGAIDAGTVILEEQYIVGVYDETLSDADVGGGPL